jgi:hypothetical protein
VSSCIKEAFPKIGNRQSNDTRFGLLQAGVVDQSLFSVNYRDIDSWEKSLRSTSIEPLGFSAYLAQLFIVGHVIYSFCAPIALVEAFRPGHRSEPWLGKVGLAVAAIRYNAAREMGRFAREAAKHAKEENGQCESTRPRALLQRGGPQRQLPNTRQKSRTSWVSATPR